MIIHAALEYEQSSWGGLGSAVQLMARAEIARGRQVIVMSLASGSHGCMTDNSNGLIHFGITLEGYSSAGDIYNAENRLELGLQLSARFFEVFKCIKLPPDAQIVVHSEALKQFMQSLLRAGHRVIYYSHGLSCQEHPDRPELDHNQREIARSGIAIATASRYQAALARRVLRTERILTVRPPLQMLVHDLASFRSATRRPTLMAGGRAVRSKGFDRLLQSLRTLRSGKLAGCDLYIGHGNEEHERYLRRLAYRCAVPVTFKGWSKQKEFFEGLATAQAIVVPSRFEALGLVAAEAIALNTPVIGTNVGGLGELISESKGVIINGDSDDEIVRDLRVTLQEPFGRVTPRSAQPVLSKWSFFGYERDLFRAFHI